MPDQDDTTLGPEDEQRLRTASHHLVSGIGPSRSDVPSTLRRAQQIARRRRTIRHGATALAAAAVIAAVVVPLAVGGSPARTGGLIPAHHGRTATTPTAPLPTTTTTAAPPASTTTTAPTTTTTSTPAVSGGTQLFTYDPFTSTGSIASTLTVTQQATGTCVIGTGVAGGGSYRCFTTQPSAEILDPCFAASVQSTTLVCPSDPAGPDVTEFTAKTPLPTTGATTAQRVWAVKLTNGQVCKQINAAWASDPSGALQLRPERSPIATVRSESSPTWSVACQPKETTATPFVTYQVTTAWQ